MPYFYKNTSSLGFNCFLYKYQDFSKAAKERGFKKRTLTCSKCSFCHVPDTSLIECLTKINRMDIVHLMETSTDPLQDHTSRSSVDTGRTIALDDSEGQSVWSVCM